jgi:polysaccharide deacetylase family protein (PEP-CTERM system associated)
MEPTALLSVDFEDWHQLVRRRVGAPGWEQPGPAVMRQTEALLALLDELGARATFFILGMAARAHPQAVAAIVARGHEIGCHGDAHLPVHSQNPREFAADLRAARQTIESQTGLSPIGYRAPAFSITRASGWAYEVLAQEGFRYDASHHESPRIRDRIAHASCEPHQLSSGLWEFPVAVWHPRDDVRVPVGGASYWAQLPSALVLRGLREAGPLPGLYLHPYEFDPRPLRPLLAGEATASQRARAAVRAAQRNVARVRAPGVLRAIARHFELIPYGEAYAKLSGGAGAGP